MLHSHGKLGIVPDLQLIGEMQARICDAIASFSPLSTSQTLVAFASMRVAPSSDALSCLEARMAEVATDLEPSDVSYSLWALARIHESNKGGSAVRSLVAKAAADAPLLTSQSVSSILCSLGTLGVHPGDAPVARLLGRLAQVIGPLSTPRDVAMALWGAGSLGADLGRDGCEAGAALRARLEALGGGDMNLRQLAMIAWGAAASRLGGEEAVDAVRRGVERLRGAMQAEQFSALHSLFLSTRLQDGREGVIDPALERECRAAFGTDFDGQQMSHLQASVAACVKSMIAKDGKLSREDENPRRGRQVKEEYIDRESGYIIDIALCEEGGVDAARVAIEVHGPVHYLLALSGRDGEMVTNGRTMMKARHLGRLGYAVVEVPFWEWPGPGEEGERYLGRLISDAERIRDGG